MINIQFSWNGDVTISIESRELSEADRLNGLQWQGEARVTPKASRIYFSDEKRFGEWMNGPSAFSIPGSFSLQKKNNQWFGEVDDYCVMRHDKPVHAFLKPTENEIKVFYKNQSITQTTDTNIDQNKSNSTVYDHSIMAADAQLNSVYSKLRNRLASKDRERLKQQEIEWIKKKETFSTGSDEQLTLTNERIKYLSDRLPETPSK